MPELSPPAFRPTSRLRVLWNISTCFSVMIVCTAIYVVVCLILFPSRRLRIYAGNAYGKIVGSTVFTIVGIKPQFRNRERILESKPAIYVCNHSATIDMWVGMWACPWGGCGTAKREIVRLPVFGLAYLLSGHLLIDRSNKERAIASMAKLGELVQKYKLSLWMWPEGTRSRSGRLLPLKKGFAHLAVATGLPVVPLVFHDADLLWPGGSIRPRPGTLHIDVLEPIDTSHWSTDTIQEHCSEVWQVFQDHLGERQKALPEPPS